APSASWGLGGRRAGTQRAARAGGTGGCAQANCRSDVEGDAATARDRAGARRVAAAAPAGRADERARSGRATHGPDAAGGAEATRRFGAAELAPAQRDRARL